jgi:hypothetical protein
VNGEQLGIYESIKSFVNGDLSNLHFVEGNEFQVMKDLLENPTPFNGNGIRDAKTALDELSQKVKDKIHEERQFAIQKVENKIALIKCKEEFLKLEKSNQNLIVTPFTEEIEKLMSQRYIGNMRNIASDSIEVMFSTQLNAIGVLLANQDSTTGKVQEPAFKYIRSADVKTTFMKSELQTEEDVNDYIDKLKLAMLEKVRDNKRITL